MNWKSTIFLSLPKKKKKLGTQYKPLQPKLRRMEKQKELQLTRLQFTSVEVLGKPTCSKLIVGASVWQFYNENP